MMWDYDAWLYAPEPVEARELRCGRCGFCWWPLDDDEACPECSELAE